MRSSFCKIFFLIIVLILYISTQLYSTDLNDIASKIEVPLNHRILNLSPDGKKVLSIKWEAPIKFFIYYTGEKKDPIEIFFEGRSVNESCISWSPDSRYFSFSENSPQLFTDSDIYICDTETQIIENITDDKYFGRIMRKMPSDTYVDICPVWEDSNTLLYLSSFYKNKKQIQNLYKIDIRKKEKTLISELSDRFIFAVKNQYYTDKNFMYYKTSYPPESSIRNYIYRLNYKAANAKKSKLNVKQHDYSIWDYSPEKKYLLLYDLDGAYREELDSPKSFFILYHVWKKYAYKLKVPRGYSVRDAAFIDIDSLLLVIYSLKEKKTYYAVKTIKESSFKNLKFIVDGALNFSSESTKLNISDSGKCLIKLNYSQAVVEKIK